MRPRVVCAGRMASEGLFKLARNVQKATFLQHAPDLKAPVGSCAQVPPCGAALPSREAMSPSCNTQLFHAIFGASCSAFPCGPGISGATSHVDGQIGVTACMLR